MVKHTIYWREVVHSTFETNRRGHRIIICPLCFCLIKVKTICNDTGSVVLICYMVNGNGLNFGILRHNAIYLTCNTVILIYPFVLATAACTTTTCKLTAFRRSGGLARLVWTALLKL